MLYYDYIKPKISTYNVFITIFMDVVVLLLSPETHVLFLHLSKTVICLDGKVGVKAAVLFLSSVRTIKLYMLTMETVWRGF